MADKTKNPRGPKGALQQVRTERNKQNAKARHVRRMKRLAETRPARKLAKRKRWIERGGTAVIAWLYGKGAGFAEEHAITPSSVGGYATWKKEQTLRGKVVIPDPEAVAA